MPGLSAHEHYAELEASTAALASLVDGTDPDLPVPTCPGWTLRQLATHVGRAHRWSAEMVRTRSAEFIEFRSVPGGKLPDDPSARGQWLTTGARALIDAVTDAGDERVWALGELRPAAFWARRMAHETLVHDADAHLAAGQHVALAAEFAADAIDEWLTIMSGPLFGRPDPRAKALPAGATLHVHATDPGLDGAGEWLVAHAGDDIQVRSGHARADVALAGPAGDLLLVLLRRVPATSEAIAVHGDRDVLDRWLANTSF